MAIRISGPPKLAKRTKPGPKRNARRVSIPKTPVRVFMGRQPFPKQLFNTLTYTESVAFNISAGTGVALYKFLANSMFDPNSTGTGRQPLYFDQLSAIYDHYTVLRSRIRVSPNHISTLPILYSLYLDDDTSAVANAVDASERIGAVSKMFIPSYGGQNQEMRLSFDAVKTFGPNPMANDNLQGTGLTSPAEQQVYTIQAYDGTGTAATGQLMVWIEYDCVWDEFTTIASS